jgi:hypothetical protein
MGELMTVNQLLVLMKAVRERLNQLKSLASSVATKETMIYGSDRERTTEPQYSIKEVDKSVVKLEMWLFKADSAIKQSNAVTKVNLDVNVDELLNPLQ